MATDPATEWRQVPVAWVGVEDVPLLFANQVLAQLDDVGEILLTFGQATPPLLLGDDEEKQAQLSNIGFVPVKPVARVAFSRPRLEQLIQLLNETLDNHRKQAEVIRKQREGNK